MGMAAPPTTYDDEQLKAFASRHVYFEIARVIEYTGALCDSNPPCGRPGPNGFRNSPHDDALFDGALIHIRLLDSFLGGGKLWKEKPEARATHWLASWTGKGCLRPEERERIDKQVAHLDVYREPSFAGDVLTHAIACLVKMETFLRQLDRRPDLADRSRAFDDTRERVRGGLRELRRKAAT